MNLPRLLEAARITHAFSSVERVVLRPGTDRWENDTEHSWQLAFMAWFIIDAKSLTLDRSKVMHYALVHDLVEVYAGDVNAYDEAAKVGKEEREHLAAERLSREFTDWPNLHEVIEAYEKREDEEAKFVYALDKLLPPINILLDEGRTWKKLGVTLQRMIDLKAKQIAVSEPVNELYLELLQFLRENEEKYYGKI